MPAITRNVVAVVLAAFMLSACASPARLRSLTPTSQPTATTAVAQAAPQATSGSTAVPSTSTADASTPTAVASAATAASTPTSVPSTPTTVPASATNTPAPQVSVTVANAANSAIKATIQRANAEQVQAFSKNDPTVMKDTATSSYYDELVQTNQDLTNGGVSAIKLIKLEWGPITLSSPTAAQATTFETWQTTYVDGSTDQSRDRNIYTMIKDGSNWLIQEDAHPDSGLDQPTGTTGSTAPQPSSPRTVSPSTSVAPASSSESRNWSGYVSTGGTYTSVTGTWTVPQPTPNGTSSSAATWVGIGGAGSRDLIQAGTEEIVSAGGQIRYGAWVEMLPAASRTVALPVSPGNSVTVTITQQSQGQWLITLKNNTTGKSYQTTTQYASSLSSAEWIEEAPSGGRQVVPLDNFGTVQFTAGSTVENGKTMTIAQSGARPITMYGSGNQTLATPSALNSDGASFSVTRDTSSSPITLPLPGFSRFPRGGRGATGTTGGSGFTIVPGD